jgi:uncharacterized protein (UPF0332 family)
MAIPPEADAYLAKAEENLTCAQSELANGRYNTCASRCYYACFQAAIAALIVEGIRPAGRVPHQWQHGFVQSQFVGLLVNRRKVYPTSLREIPTRLQGLRLRADYSDAKVSRRDARSATEVAQTFVTAIRNLIGSAA